MGEVTWNSDELPGGVVVAVFFVVLAQPTVSRVRTRQTPKK